MDEFFNPLITFLNGIMNRIDDTMDITKSFKMINTIILCAIPQEVEGLHYTDIFFTGVGKINAAATTEHIIKECKLAEIGCRFAGS